ncbi:hypothetical protein GUJ93_ZPchr0012g20178 [Zizania palustris]|uniref:Uncharacterized protein n=1 Tax=Zizania palustris TaxID=103762 RepID=A0A8J5WXY3_ZIZPA|nr:hypothetical protein GUJ93_ZPchr0012g20178 [Zizania palustris]
MFSSSACWASTSSNFLSINSIPPSFSIILAACLVKYRGFSVIVGSDTKMLTPAIRTKNSHDTTGNFTNSAQQSSHRQIHPSHC